MSVKMMLYAFAAAGVGGAALTSGGTGGGLIEHEIARPPIEVYSAISAMAQEGVQVRPAELGPPMTFEVRKERGKALHYLLRLDGKLAGSIDLNVAPDKDGAASKLSGDVELDRKVLAALGPSPLDSMPDSLLDLALAGQLGELAAQIEAGTPLEPFGPEDLAIWRENRVGGI
jgi:hypothetical protein